MKDRWINAGFEEDELKPYTEPELDITDQKRIGKKKKKQTDADVAGKLIIIMVLFVHLQTCDAL